MKYFINITTENQTMERVIMEQEVKKNIVNKGTGAGGANTNVNGLSYEEKTNLEELYIECNYNKKDKYKTIKFAGYDCELVNVNKGYVHKFMERINEKNNSIKPAAGCKEPDEAYIDVSRKIIFIIEKKFQQTPGSVDEKIQTGPFKQYHYSKTFPNFKVQYLYCLSVWFKRTEYSSVLEYLQECNIPVFWGNSEEYKKDLIKFMCG